ncbi:thiol-disulfide oxidoreductase [Chlorogloea sp. CCALA 695]|nr:DCC1-like thiol-disulfide oxidoreductase family protein [Chlorogloea sp. CCALA 695]PSB28415.1 thiol-disulfide oxidoreductase [Chlorogloea sp. CCALA 695]
MTYYVIYDGNCNLCTNLVQILETIDQGKLFQYAPMQAEDTLKRWDITPNNCELGMIVIDASAPERRWQGSAAAEKIGELLPLGVIFVTAYRLLPGLKWAGNRIYEQIRDNRYSWFGKRDTTYNSAYGVDCGCSPSKKL